MHFPNTRSSRALIQPPVYRCRNRQGTSDNGADACEEAGEGFGAGFAVDDFHGGDVVGEEDAGDTASALNQHA